jgi:hypothetical protein
MDTVSFSWILRVGYRMISPSPPFSIYKLIYWNWIFKMDWIVTGNPFKEMIYIIENYRECNFTSSPTSLTIRHLNHSNFNLKSNLQEITTIKFIRLSSLYVSITPNIIKSHKLQVIIFLIKGVSIGLRHFHFQCIKRLWCGYS